MTLAHRYKMKQTPFCLAARLDLDNFGMGKRAQQAIHTASLCWLFPQIRLICRGHGMEQHSKCDQRHLEGNLGIFGQFKR